VIALLLQLAVSDCRVTIADCRLQRPAIVTPTSALGTRQSSGVNADSVPVFTLAQALEAAVKLNPDYVQALGRVSEAEWTRTAARVAFFVPTLTANLDLTKYSTEFFNIGTLTPSSTSVTGRLDARYELFSVRKLTQLGRSQAELESATATEVQQRFAAAMLTESDYYAVLAEEELVRVATERAARAEEQLRVARARVVSGAAVQSDSLTVRLELTRARVDLMIAQVQLRVARLEFGRRVGIAGPATAAPIDEDLLLTLPLSLEAAIAQALDQGPTYRVARADERSARAALRGDRGGYFPTVNLAASHTRFDTGFFPNARNVSSITLNFSFTLWNGGDRELAIIQSRARLDVASAFRADLERAALRDVTAAYETYETARAAVDLAREAVVIAQENFRVQQARYQGGATTVLDLLNAQFDLTDAQAKLIQARFANRTALAQLEAILGTRLMSSTGGSQ
jgi:outer membrane protein